MFRWLKTGLAGLTAEECDLLENYVLKWDIHGQTWLRDEDWTENPDGYGAPWNDRRQAVLTQVNQLRRRVREPLERLAAERRALYAACAHYRIAEPLLELAISQIEEIWKGARP